MPKSPTRRPNSFPAYAMGRFSGRRTMSLFAVASISFMVLLFTAKRLGAWQSLDESPHSRPDLDRNHHPPFGGGGNPKPGAQSGMPPRPNHDPLCDNFPDTSGILLIMKTGGSEAFERIPTQVMTMLRCVPDFLIFSDLDQDIAGYRVYDSLDTVLPSVVEGNPDFDLYRRQKLCEVDQGSCNKLGNTAYEAWTLDKYKNNHISEKAYKMRPGYDWYLFVDADTYVVWPSMVKWLRTLDPNKKLYLGSHTAVGAFRFAHGGSGYLVSQAVMKEYVGDNPGIANRFDDEATRACCGDYLFGLAVANTTRTHVQHMWPTINGEKPYTILYGPTQWCQPITTMHHLATEEISAFWQYERRRYETNPSAAPIIIREIYDHFVANKLKESRDDWDNMGDHGAQFYYVDMNGSADDWEKARAQSQGSMNELEKVAHESFEACGAACKSLSWEKCFMWRYENGKCIMSKRFTLGKPVKMPEGQIMKSGWDVKKIKQWVADQPACGTPKFPEVQG